MNPRKINVGQDAHNVWLLLTRGDKSADEIRAKLGLGKNRWKHARRALKDKVGTVNGKPPTFTII